MPRVRLLLVLGLFVAIAAIQDPSKALFAQNSSESKLEVLSPWAEVDPIPLKGISPRIDNLAGKKIGLFVNYKRAARPIGLSLEKRLKSMYPGSEIVSSILLIGMSWRPKQKTGINLQPGPRR